MRTMGDSFDVQGWPRPYSLNLSVKQSPGNLSKQAGKNVSSSYESPLSITSLVTLDNVEAFQNLLSVPRFASVSVT